jgi:hydroxymethylbilane synthase
VRPDLSIVPLRGNVPTRLAKLERESLDAVVLACAGSTGSGSPIASPSGSIRCGSCPRWGRARSRSRRGAATRSPRSSRRSRIPPPRRASRPSARVRRSSAPTATSRSARHALLARDRIALRVRLLDPERGAAIERTLEGDARDAEAIGARAAEEVLAAGGAALLARLRAAGGQ